MGTRTAFKEPEWLAIEVVRNTDSGYNDNGLKIHGPVGFPPEGSVGSFKSPREGSSSSCVTFR